MGRRDEERQTRDRDEKRRERRNDFVEKMSQTRKIRQTNQLILIRKKSPSDEFFVPKYTILSVFFNYLHDSNSIFRPAGINSE